MRRKQGRPRNYKEKKGYPNGYNDKIEYYKDLLLSACTLSDEHSIAVYTQKLQYFEGRQYDLDWKALSKELVGIIGEDSADVILCTITSGKSTPQENVASLKDAIEDMAILEL